MTDTTPTYFVVSKARKTIYYEAIDPYDADGNCPPEYQVICVFPDKFESFFAEYSNKIGA